MSSVKKLRACLMCSFVATPADFRKEGCPNCEDYLEMKGSAERVAECTTAIFDGVISYVAPQKSWVARWQKNDSHVPGSYAVKLSGQLPSSTIEDLEARGIKVMSREMDEE